jgi:glycosyltransferase involved in cell wall biosynthesis
MRKPELSPATPLGALLAEIAPEADGDFPDERRFLSVVVRTQGRRPTLIDTLTCLAAQTVDDFEVLLFVDTPSDADAATVNLLLEQFDHAFAQRVRLQRVRASNRSAPLNAAIDLALGRWFAVLDDDDLVTADWVETFRDGAREPDVIVRSRAVEQHVHRTHDAISDLQPTSGFLLPYDREFDLVRHMILNQSPIHTLAFPTGAIRRLGIRFDLSLPAHEDIDVLLRAAQLCGVHDIDRVTAIYRRWDDVEASAHSLPADAWAATRARVRERLDASPLLLPAGSATRMATLFTELDRLADIERRLLQMERSRTWRFTRPVRTIARSAAVRRVAAAVRRVRRR